MERSSGVPRSGESDRGASGAYDPTGSRCRLVIHQSHNFEIPLLNVLHVVYETTEEENASDPMPSAPYEA